MILSVASGKGGTGKTTIATSLAQSLSDIRVTFLDCDVEAPNAHLFLRPRFDQRGQVELLMPQVDQGRCDGNQRCVQVCQYHAIVYLAGRALVFPELCHACGSCALTCPQNAIQEVPRTIGILERGMVNGHIDFAHGLLNIGEPMAVPVIRQLKQWMADANADIVIRDAPPGTSCPVVESVRDSDYVLLVTEPTPFGLHDLKLAAQLVGEFGIPAGVIINREGIGDTAPIEAFCQVEGLPILMGIPMQREIAQALATGQTLVDAFPGYRRLFQELYVQVCSQCDVSRVGAK